VKKTRSVETTFYALRERRKKQIQSGSQGAHMFLHLFVHEFEVRRGGSHPDIQEFGFVVLGHASFFIICLWKCGMIAAEGVRGAGGLFLGTQAYAPLATSSSEILAIGS
jgi:hypothetical protein